MAQKITVRRFVKSFLIYFFIPLIAFYSILFAVSYKPSAKPKVYPEVSFLNKNPMTFGDYSRYLDALAKKKGAAYAYIILKLTKLAPGTDLHLLSHVIGAVLYQQQGAGGIKICTADFQYGCSHSIVIGLFVHKGLTAIPEITKACKEAPGPNAYASCFHGVGHGVLDYLGYDLPKAIKTCKQMGPDIEYTECSGGAAMEMIDGGIGDPKTWAMESPIYLLKNDPLSPCDQNYIPKEIKPICYLYLTPRLMDFGGVNWGNPDFSKLSLAFNLCKKIPKDDTQSIALCYGGFGKDLTLLANNRDIETFQNMTRQQFRNVFSWCKESGTPEATNICISYAIGSFYWNGANSPKASIEFCNSIPEEDYKNYCQNDLKQIGITDEAFVSH